jgi:competence ComEA-like helix-hairpin-helix protein
VVASLVLAISIISTVRFAAPPGEESPCTPRVTLERWLIDLSSAPIAELALLPEVGPQLAARIVADRAVHGPFATIDELSRVSGFGDAKIEAIREFAIARGARGAAGDATQPQAARSGHLPSDSARGARAR